MLWLVQTTDATRRDSFVWSPIVFTQDCSVSSRPSFDEVRVGGVNTIGDATNLVYCLVELAVWTQLQIRQDSFVWSPIVFTPPTRQDKTVLSRPRRRCEQTIAFKYLISRWRSWLYAEGKLYCNRTKSLFGNLSPASRNRLGRNFTRSRPIRSRGTLYCKLLAPSAEPAQNGAEKQRIVSPTFRRTISVKLEHKHESVWSWILSGEYFEICPKGGHFPRKTHLGAFGGTLAVSGISHVKKCDWLMKIVTDWRLEVNLKRPLRPCHNMTGGDGG